MFYTGIEPSSYYISLFLGGALRALIYVLKAY